MDRLAPTRRPEGPNAGTQSWRELLFVHYEVDAAALREVLPRALSLDLWEGRAFVGLVPFLMRRIAPRFVPGALGLNFLETNLRAYVHHEGRPGVFFFSLDASSPFAVRVARAFWGLPYFDARMRFERDRDERSYHTVRAGSGSKLTARWRASDATRTAAPGTIEHFLLERYLLFVERAGALHVGQVHHAPYPIAADVDLLRFEQSLLAPARLRALDTAPAYVHASPGVDVEVFATRPV